MALPSDEVVSRVMHFLVEKFDRGRNRIVSVDELRAVCGLDDEGYRNVFHHFSREKIFEPKADRLWINEVVGEYAPRLSHCTLNDLLQFSRSRRHRNHMLRIFSAVAARQRSERIPAFTIKTLLDFGQTTDEGQIVRAVALPWFEVMKMIENDPESIYKIDPFDLEEIIAGAYRQAGFDEVVLTPRSGDKGRDVIAIQRGIVSVRVLDQVKAYKPGHLVSAKEVREMAGVISVDGGATKGIITTTSDFAPRVLDDDNVARLIPYRLELKPRDELLPWLEKIWKAENE